MCSFANQSSYFWGKTETGEGSVRALSYGIDLMDYKRNGENYSNHSSKLYSTLSEHLQSTLTWNGALHPKDRGINNALKEKGFFLYLLLKCFKSCCDNMDKNSPQTDLLILLLPHLGTKTEHLTHSSNFPVPLKTPPLVYLHKNKPNSSEFT